MSVVDVDRAPSSSGATSDLTRSEWAVEHTATLRRVMVELQSIQAPVAPPPATVGGAHAASAERLLENLVAAAMRRIDAEAEAARAASDVVIEAAMRQAAARLESIGSLPARVANLSAAPPVEGDGELFGPDALWDLDADETFERFWGTNLEDRTVLDRVRRWAQRESS